MATARRANTAEYYFNTSSAAPDLQPERVKRTRERPEKKDRTGSVREIPIRPGKRTTMEPVVLRALVMGVVIIGMVLIGIVLVNAQAAELQYSINQIREENSQIETQIDMMKIKIESNTGINRLEEYATDKLEMHYPQGNECIHLSSVEAPAEGFADLIREKAYE